jgi:hypothetical protein
LVDLHHVSLGPQMAHGWEMIGLRRSWRRSISSVPANSGHCRSLLVLSDGATMNQRKWKPVQALKAVSNSDI